MKVAGMVGFSTQKNNIISRLVRKIRTLMTGKPCEFTHVFMLYGKLAGEIIIGESTFPWSQIVKIDSHVKATSKLEIWKVNVSEEQINDAIRVLLSKLHRIYNPFIMIGYVWIYLMSKLGLRNKNPFQDGDVCSKYIYYALKEWQFPGIDEQSANETAPDVIRELFLARPEMAKVVGVSEYGSALITWLEPVE